MPLPHWEEIERGKRKGKGKVRNIEERTLSLAIFCCLAIMGVLLSSYSVPSSSSDIDRFGSSSNRTSIRNRSTSVTGTSTYLFNQSEKNEEDPIEIAKMKENSLLLKFNEKNLKEQIDTSNF